MTKCKSLTTVLTIFAFAMGPAAGAAPLTADEILAAISVDGRTEGDAGRDAGRRAHEVLAYLGLEKNMTVLDVMASAGWYTEAVALALDGTGKVYAHNTPAMLRFRDGASDRALDARIENGRLPNVRRINGEFDALGISGEVDIAITALNFHDIYHRNPDGAVAMLEAVKATLKPGGVFGVIDHNGAEGADNARLHRIHVDKVVAAAKAAGFDVESSDLLKNPGDDLSKMVFAPGVRGKTDRFLLKLSVPRGEH